MSPYRLVTCALAASAAAVYTSGQIISGADFRVRYDLTARSTGNADGSLPWGPTGSALTVDNSTAAQAVRFEVRYTLFDARPNDGRDILGFGGAEFDIRSNVPQSSGAGLSFARLLASDNGDPVPARNSPVPSGPAFAPLPAIGLANPFRPHPDGRGRLGARPDGTLGTLDSWPVVPVQVAQPAIAPDLNTSYFLYAFNLTIPTTLGPGAYAVSVRREAESGGGVFAANFNSPNPSLQFVTISPNNISFGVDQIIVNVVPSPGSITVLACAGVLVARRRRH